VPVTQDPGERPPLDRTRLAHPEADLAPDLVVEVVDEAPSTNALVAERAREGAAEGLVIVAEHQTAGRGRLDRVWETPPRAALTQSLLLRPSVPPAAWPWLPLLTGYAVAKALRAEGFAAEVKWPNDVLIGGRKVAGILAEAREGRVVLGIGINVNVPADGLPAEIDRPATSLLAETGSEIDRAELLVELLAVLEQRYDAWVRNATGT
jgi:BirA family biotin operon repressor/biotin-[acetyl-CoA-carboxylase] ligase